MKNITSKEELRLLKDKARQKFKTLRSSILEKSTPATKLMENFFTSVNLPKNCVVASYIPIKSEINVIPLNKALIESGHTVVVPVEDYTHNILIFKKCTFINNDVNIYNEIMEPEVIIVPMLAFDSRLMRIGYGKGWYDKTIHHIKSKSNKFTIGVAYDIQFSEENLPCDDFDQILDIIVTESHTYQ